MRVALALWLAHIPKRYGPATKLAQLFLNRRLKQKRSLSLKPEFEYNVDLVRHYISCNSDKVVDIQNAPYLLFDSQEIAGLRKTYITKHGIDTVTKLIFIHAGSGGSAINLSTQQFAELARLIEQSNNVHFVLTAGPRELETANYLSEHMKKSSHFVYNSTEGLVNFSKFINICDLFISGSTGPLHIAAALNVPTAAFYPARQSATSLRWQTTNDKEKRLAFMPDKYTGENDMKTIDIKICAAEINTLLERLYK